MRYWLLGILYLFVVCGLLLVSGLLLFSGGVGFVTIDPSLDDGMVRGRVCERGANAAPECALPPNSADKVLDAFLSCDKNFFQVLKEEKAVFGRTEITFLPYNLLSSEEPRTTVVTFVEPIEAFGLHLVGYTQDWSLTKSATSKDYRWGFRVVEHPDEVARAIEAHHPETKGFRPYGFEPGARRSQDWPLLLWTREAPNFPGTNVDCFGARESNGMEELPYAPDLFLSQPGETGFAKELRLFVASVAKTIARFRRL